MAPYHEQNKMRHSELHVTCLAGEACVTSGARATVWIYTINACRSMHARVAEAFDYVWKELKALIKPFKEMNVIIMVYVTYFIYM